MIINMAHVEIDRYKVERQVKYCRVMREFAEYKVVANNDVRNYDNMGIDAWDA
jgi:hypothetical protein